MAEPHPAAVLTYVADDAFEPPALAGLLPPNGATALPGAVSEGEVARHRLDATYFDTADLRLAATGVTLRRRTGGDDAGWQLTAPGRGDAHPVLRLPPGRVPPGRTPRAVPDQLLAMVWAQTVGAPLEPVARVTTERTVRRLTDVTGRVLVELADDRVTARRLRQGNGAGPVVGAAATWREIGVALPGDEDGIRAGIDAGLRGEGRLDPAAGPQLTRVLDGEVPRPPRAAGPALTVRSPSGAVLQAHLRVQVGQVRAQDLPVRLDQPDSVHRMRVATRRLRSALQTFERLVDPAVVRPLRDELKWLAAELGAARDAEVMRDRVATAVAGQRDEAGVRAGGDAVGFQLTAAYRAAHDRVLADLDGDRYRELLGRLVALVERPPFRRRARKPAGTLLPSLVARSFTRVERLVAEADELPAGADRDEVLHEARKAAKQARYAGEAVAPVFGKDATAFAAALEGVQEALGEHQDSIVTRERLHELAVHASSTEVAFLYGRLHALEEACAGETRQRFDTAWKAAGRGKLHRWLA